MRLQPRLERTSNANTGLARVVRHDEIRHDSHPTGWAKYHAITLSVRDTQYCGPNTYECVSVDYGIVRVVRMRWAHYYDVVGVKL